MVGTRCSIAVPCFPSIRSDFPAVFIFCWSNYLFPLEDWKYIRLSRALTSFAPHFASSHSFFSQDYFNTSANEMWSQIDPLPENT